MQVDRTLEALALRCADDMDLVARREAADVDLLTDREAGNVVEAHLAQVLERRQPLEVTALGLGHLLLEDRAKADLHGGIAVALLCTDARDQVLLGRDD